MNKKFRSINFLYYNNPGLAKTPVSEKRQSKLRYQTDETGGGQLPPPTCPFNSAICKKRQNIKTRKKLYHSPYLVNEF